MCGKWGVCAVRCGGKVVSVRRGPGHVGSGVVVVVVVVMVLVLLAALVV